MKKRIENYLEFIDKILSYDLPVNTAFDLESNHYFPAKKDVAPTKKDYEKLLTTHLAQISFFQHERLVHLIVTVIFAILAFAVFLTCFFAPNIPLFILLILILVLLIPYIFHYYRLENGVQKMYKQYDEILKRTF